MKIYKKDSGFTLVELIIVIAIMAILSAAIAPAVIRYIEKARKADDVQTAKIIFDAVNLH
ncbi:MAG: prepilin-type N-terminal cleavage/methylation domain-containing protein [Eubacterium sp.]|nr:prepilin-type N-terminal cleavage/methylation domain-containing protein [Eubacterium sp.]